MERSTVVKFSFIFFFSTLLLVGAFHIATPFVTVLFSLFALNKFHTFNRKWISVATFFLLVGLIFYGFYSFAKQSIRTLPQVAASSIPLAIHYAEEFGIELPFSDLSSLKAVVVEGIRTEIEGVAKFAEIATKEFVFLIIGLVVAVSIFLNDRIDLNRDQHPVHDNLYSAALEEISRRFSNFFSSFKTVMGAQLIISTINTVCTGLFVIIAGIPSPFIVIVVTFLCGLLPIIGNLISNTLIFAIAITKSLNLALFALLYLIVIHKVEYFLNSRIIGGRIKNPMWLTLIGLLVGERVMGIPGMILAPVVLHYLRLESSSVEIKSK